MIEKQTIIYRFESANGTTHEIDASLNTKSLRQFSQPTEPSPEWSRLEHHQCINCPLQAAEHPFCPLAQALAPLIETFNGHVSHEEVSVTVITDERTTQANTTLQRALSSLLGLIIATSGCPHATPFQAMAHFHLPFSNNKETIYRATANYLLSQYFQGKQEPDWQLSGLKEIYQQLQIVNRGISQRLRSVCDQDAAVNAVVLLDLFAKDIPYSIDEALEEISPLFNLNIAPSKTN